MNSKTKSLAYTCTLIFLLLPLLSAEDMKQPPDSLVVPPSPVVSPEDAVKSFQIEKGFVVELVASEPLLEDPVCATFDGNGRIWVAEMRGFMPNIAGTGEEVPNGQIAILEDTDNDGRMDKRTLVVDKIVLPRALTIVKGGILYADMRTLYFVPVKDDKPGKQVVIDPKYSTGNVEHSANGLMHGLDNWIYNAKSDKRYRLIGKQWQIESAASRGQWGITRDNYGRIIATGNSSVMSYEKFAPNLLIRNSNYTFGSARSFSTSTRVNPIRPTPGTNRAYYLSGDYVLRNITAACGMSCYRGDNFPKEYQDNIFTPAPAVNLVTRTEVHESEGVFKTVRKNEPEFFATKDERSRIVNSYTAPDGSLYLIDFYRGILQHKAYLTPYLKKQIKKRGLDKPLGLGRIYRVRHTSKPVGTQPKMQAETSLELVAHLEHPNGWWRDTAQRLLVERYDEDSVDAIRQMATNSKNELGRIHALWTLEGLNRLDLATLKQAAEMESPQVRANVVRLCEQLSENSATLSLLRELAADPAFDVQLQLAFTLGQVRGEIQSESLKLLKQVLVSHGKQKVFQHAAVTGLQGLEIECCQLFSAVDKLQPARNALIQCVLRSRNATKISRLLNLEKKGSAGERQILLATAKTAIKIRDAKSIRLVLKKSETLELKAKQNILNAMASAIPKKFRPIRINTESSLLTKWAGSDAKSIQAEIDKVAKLIHFAGPLKDYLTTDVHHQQFEAGKRHYQQLCIGCHAKSGEGIDINGGPPLAGSQWVLGDPKLPIAIVLNGMRGPVKVGTHIYKSPEVMPLMPGLRTASEVTDENIAAVLTYIRNNWENRGEPVTPQQVRDLRKETEKMDLTYTQEQLLNFDKTLTKIKSGQFGQSLATQLLAEDIDKLVAEALSRGDVANGEQLIRKSKSLSCLTCHAVAGEGAKFGPDLAKLDAKLSPTHLIESILEPSKVINEKFQSITVTTFNGRDISGILLKKTKTATELIDPKDGQVITIAEADIEEDFISKKSYMPDGLANEFSNRQQFMDVVHYLMKLNKLTKEEKKNK